jgi:hypothetical protein
MCLDAIQTVAGAVQGGRSAPGLDSSNRLANSIFERRSSLTTNAAIVSAPSGLKWVLSVTPLG